MTQYRNIAVWISRNIDIGRSLNCRDSFPRKKFKNRAPTSYSPGPMLWLPTIGFELRAKTAEEIDLEKCTFRNFRSSVTLTLTLDRVEVTLVRICGRGLPTHQIRWKSEKLFGDVRMYGSTDGRTDRQTLVPISPVGDDLIPCLHDTTGCQTGCTTAWQPAVSCKQTSNRLSNRFDNRLNVCLHDTTGCQTGLTTYLTTGLTTGCIV